MENSVTIPVNNLVDNRLLIDKSGRPKCKNRHLKKAWPPNLQQRPWFNLVMVTFQLKLLPQNESLPSTSAFFVDLNKPIATYFIQCKAQCCQHSLDVYQVTDHKVLKSTRKALGILMQIGTKVIHGWFSM